MFVSWFLKPLAYQGCEGVIILQCGTVVSYSSKGNRLGSNATYFSLSVVFTNHMQYNFKSCDNDPALQEKSGRKV